MLVRWNCACTRRSTCDAQVQHHKSHTISTPTLWQVKLSRSAHPLVLDSSHLKFHSATSKKMVLTTEGFVRRLMSFSTAVLTTVMFVILEEHSALARELGYFSMAKLSSFRDSDSCVEQSDVFVLGRHALKNSMDDFEKVRFRRCAFGKISTSTMPWTLNQLNYSDDEHSFSTVIFARNSQAKLELNVEKFQQTCLASSVYLSNVWN